MEEQHGALETFKDTIEQLVIAFILAFISIERRAMPRRTVPTRRAGKTNKGKIAIEAGKGRPEKRP